MRRALPFALVALPAILAVALAGPSDASRNGTITFSGQITDSKTPLAPGRIVTVRGDVIARTAGCIEASVALMPPTGQSKLWLCSPSDRTIANMPDVGDPIAARARITGMKTTAEGEIALSDSFVLMQAD